MKKNKRILLALSGGVDSAVAALLLKKKGYDIQGAFIKSFSETKNKFTGHCSWREEYKEAQKIASLLHIPLVFFDFEKEYRTLVINPMIKAYKKGITPNPDISCNTLIKFPLLWKAAQSLDADYIATGHHARIKKTKKGYELHQGIDKTKDQSYFLAELSQKDLAHSIMPIGSLTKENVRKIAKKNKFPNFDRQSSRGVCFIGNVPLKVILEKKIRKKRGVVLNENGQVIGTHKGAHYYTWGERVRPTIGIDIKKGVHAQERWYVATKNMEKNTLTVAPEKSPLLSRNSFHLQRITWIIPSQKKKILKAQARIRHLGEFIPATLTLEGTKGTCRLAKRIQRIAPGQSAVFYKGTKVICSGEITL